MKDVIFALPGIALTVICWGTYGPVLHKGQAHLGGDRLKPLICVGAAYFLIAILVPVIFLAMTKQLGGNWTPRGITMSMIAGSCGALGALGIILALTSGGKPIYVMPLVFGGAPIINVLVSMRMAGMTSQDMGARFPWFLAGVIMVAVGAAVVLVAAPKGPKPGAKPKEPAAVHRPAETTQVSRANQPADKQPDSPSPTTAPDTTDS